MKQTRVVKIDVVFLYRIFVNEEQLTKDMLWVY